MKADKEREARGNEGQEKISERRKKVKRKRIRIIKGNI